MNQSFLISMRNTRKMRRLSLLLMEKSSKEIFLKTK